MRTTDWNYNFSSLPRWDNRERIPYIYDKFYEIPQKDVLCCIYSIAEAGMMDYIGFLAILKEKENPSLLLNIAEGYNFCDNFSVSADGNFIFLQPSIYDKEYGVSRPILIIDLNGNRFSYVLTGNYSTTYQVKQKSERVFVVEADVSQKDNERLQALHGKEIRIDELKWYSMKKIQSLPEIIFK